MANIFIPLTIPAGNGAGAAVDVSTMGALKTILLSGTGWNVPGVRPPTVNIEMNNSPGPTGSWAPVATLRQNGQVVTVNNAARWMRVRVSGFQGGTVTGVNVGGTDDGSTFVNLPVTAGNGVGAPVDVSAMGTFKTPQISDAFGGAVIIELSEDAGGVDFGQVIQMNAPGQTSQVIDAYWARARRTGVPNLNPGLPVVYLGATNPASGGGGAVTFTTVTMQELRFSPAISPAALGAGETNNYNPAGFSTTTRVRITSDAGGSQLSGLVAQNDGDVRILENISGGILTIEHEDVSSTAANRFTTPGAVDIALAVGGAVQVIYDGTTARWLIIGIANTAGGSSFSEISLTPALSPAALAAGNTNDYAPAGIVTTSRIRQATNAAGSTLTGLSAQGDGDVRIIQSLGAGPLTLANENAGSAAANRFTLPNGVDMTIPTGASAILNYSTTTSRWVLMAVVHGQQPFGGLVISPATIAGAVNDYTPTGLAQAATVRQDLTAPANITGMATGQANRLVTIWNISTTQLRMITINHENAGSAAANRFSLPSGLDWILPNGGSATFWYDATSSCSRAPSSPRCSSRSETTSRTTIRPCPRQRPASGSWTPRA